MAEWFSKWFDSKYYHILYKDRDFTEAQGFLNKLMRSLNMPKSVKILDLACGKGRHSIYLHSLGYEVMGLDLSANSIAKASENTSQGLSFGVHDMRNRLPDAPYDLVLNLFTSFGYFNNPEEDIQTLQNIADSLTLDGVFVFDFLNISYIENNLLAHEEKLVDGTLFKLHRYFENGSLCKDIVFVAEDKEYRFQERVDALEDFHFEQYFAKVGLKISHKYGSYNLDDFDAHNSKRLIYITQKIL